MSVIFICKAAGALLVIITGLYISAEYSRSVNDMISAARDAERLLRYIGEAITYRADAVGDIIASYDGACTVTRDVWHRASESTLSDALKTSPLPFDAETTNILSEFASQLGRGYREPQAELCRLFSGRLDEHARSLESSKKDRLSVSTSVCIFVSLSLIIFFI